MCTSVERGKKERGLGGGEGAFFVLQATLFFAPLHLAACSQANISPQFFSSSVRAIQIVLPRGTDWLDRAG